MRITTDTKSVNNIAVTILAILLASIIAYYVGVAYEAANEAQVNLDQVSIDSILRKKSKVAFVATSAADATATWKLYTSDTHKFTFKYPADYAVTDNKSDQRIYVASGNGDKKVWISYKTTEATADQERTISTSRDANPNISLQSSVLTTSDGNVATVYEVVDTKGVKSIDAFVTNGSARYAGGAMSGVSADAYDAQKTLLKLMLSSFKFTK